MLSMTRKPGDRIAIGDNIVVTVLEIQGARVQLGIDAPKDVKIRSAEAPERPEPPRK
jgi:carbon storage regulator